MTEIGEGREADAAAAAALHASEIREGFLSTLGAAFLTRLYRRMVRSPESFLLVARADGEVVGFVAGTEEVRALYRSFLVHDGVVAGVMALPQLARSWRRVFETLRYPAGGGDDHADLPRAELLSIAVAPAARGRGAGIGLVEALTAEFTRRGIDAVRVVVGADNDSAIRLYERAGFTTAAQLEVHKGTPSLALTWP